LIKHTTKKVVLVKLPEGEIKATLHCPKVTLNLRGVDFRAKPFVLSYSSIDVILGVDWLTVHHAVIQGANKTMLVRTKLGEIIEVKATSPEELQGNTEKEVDS
jgi:hypothetical protein